jgi:hypothetical protein
MSSVEPAPTDTPTPGLPPTLPPLNTPTPTPTPTETQSASLWGSLVLAVRRPSSAESPWLNPDTVMVIVADTDGVPLEGLPVYVFDGATYTGMHDVTDVGGEVTFDLPDGS